MITRNWGLVKSCHGIVFSAESKLVEPKIPKQWLHCSACCWRVTLGVCDPYVIYNNLPPTGQLKAVKTFTLSLFWRSEVQALGGPSCLWRLVGSLVVPLPASDGCRRPFRGTDYIESAFLSTWLFSTCLNCLLTSHSQRMLVTRII